MTETEKKIKIAAIGDLHVEKKPSEVTYDRLFERISEEADVLALCGDLTSTGGIEEAEFLAEQLKHCSIPVVGVFGNHDYESGTADRIKEIIESDNVRLLNGESHIIQGVGFSGTKGFGGGFRGHMLAPFGEEMIKRFAQEAVSEALNLERALSELNTEKRVVILHYSPIRETLDGEDPEIFPFLGSSRLEESIDNFTVSVVFHGHAHYGSHEGKTSKNIPVYNVAFPILQKISPEKPYKIVEI